MNTKTNLVFQHLVDNCSGLPVIQKEDYVVDPILNYIENCPDDLFGPPNEEIEYVQPSVETMKRIEKMKHNYLNQNWDKVQSNFANIVRHEALHKIFLLAAKKREALAFLLRSSPDLLNPIGIPEKKSKEFLHSIIGQYSLVK